LESSDVQEVKLVFVGFGTVAQGCATHLVKNSSYLKQRYGFAYKVVAITDTVKGSIQNNAGGVDLSKALELMAKGEKLDGQELTGKTGLSSLDTIKTSDADIVVEATWTNLKDGEPGLSHIVTALESGLDVVTSNKGPIALSYRKLLDLAKSKRRRLRFESTVMSGTPVFNLQEFGLTGAKVNGLKGILNGTTNYILTEMATGKSYNGALKRAQELGYAEADPSGDVEAYDPAAKITILGNALMGADVKYENVKREGINGLTIDDIENAAQSAKRIKLIASASRAENGSVEASVKPTLVPDTDILAHVSGVMNALQISTDVQPEVTIMGPGAGGDSAGYGLLNDILAVHRLMVS
jgi:homoserine dehydrogenase